MLPLEPSLVATSGAACAAAIAAAATMPVSPLVPHRNGEDAGCGGNGDDDDADNSWTDLHRVGMAR